MPGFPIQTSPDHGIFAPPRGFSQLITSFFGSWCQGIRPAPFLAWPFGLHRTLRCCPAFAFRYSQCPVLFSTVFFHRKSLLLMGCYHSPTKQQTPLKVFLKEYFLQRNVSLLDFCLFFWMSRQSDFSVSCLRICGFQGTC